MSKKGPVRLSFMDDDEEEVVSSTKFSSKGSKKIKQATVYVPPPVTTLQSATASSSSSMYTKENLEKLKSQQNFASKDTSTVVETVIETSSIVLNPETIPESGNIFPESFGIETEHGKEIAAEIGNKYEQLEEELERRKNTKGKKNDRVYTSTLFAPEMRHMDLTEDNDEEWENSIMKRGIFTTGNTSANEVVMKNSQKIQSIQSSLKANQDDVHILDIINLVQSAIDTSNRNVELEDRRISQLQMEMKIWKEKVDSLTAAMNNNDSNNNSNKNNNEITSSAEMMMEE